MGRCKTTANVMIVASCGAEVYRGPCLWTVEPANWNSIVGVLASRSGSHWAFAFIQFGLITGMQPVLFSPHGNKSCPRLLPSTCCPAVSPGAPQCRGLWSTQGFRRGLEKVQPVCHWAPYGTSLRLSPWTWPSIFSCLLSSSLRHTHFFTPRLKI